jgi:hypothetical protein
LFFNAWCALTLLHDLHRSVIVAMVTVRMVQVPADKIVYVIAMRNRFMAAAWTMYMERVMLPTGMLRRASFRVGAGHRNDVLFDGSIVKLVMQMTVVQVIDVVVVFDRGMTTIFAMLMMVIHVNVAGHRGPFLLLQDLFISRIQSVNNCTPSIIRLH